MSTDLRGLGKKKKKGGGSVFLGRGWYPNAHYAEPTEGFSEHRCPAVFYFSIHAKCRIFFLPGMLC